MFQSVTTLQLSEPELDAIIKKGFVYCDDLRKSDLKFDKSKNSEKITVKSALDLCLEESKIPSIATFCKEIDDCILEGVPLKRSTEFCGVSGTGKTQMCLQLCVDVQIPKSFGGTEGRALFIDTNKGFTTRRLRQIAKCCIEHCENVAKYLNSDQLKEDLKRFSVDNVMNNVFYTKALDKPQLVHTIHNSLENFLKTKSNIRLIIIDSLSFPLRTETEGRVSLLYQLFSKMQYLADKYLIAIVVTNEMTTRVGLSEDSTQWVVPALGDSYAHRINYRVILNKSIEAGKFSATIQKSPMNSVKTVSFAITAEGIRSYK